MRASVLILIVLLCACGGEGGSGVVEPPESDIQFNISTTTPSGQAIYHGTTSYTELDGGHLIQGVAQEASGDGAVLTITVTGELKSGTYSVDRDEAEVQLRVVSGGAIYESTRAGGFVTLALEDDVISGGFTLTFENAQGEDASAEGDLQVQEGFTRN